MWTFRAMNTDVTVAAPLVDAAAEEALATRIADLFDDVEHRFSRFRHDSELSRLNRATEPVAVSPQMIDVLRAARAHVEATQGVFDPAIGAALDAAGYDRSFAPGVLDRETPIAVAARARFNDLEIGAGTVHRPSHLRIDVGGFLKGRTVDAAAALAPGCSLVDAGGDMVLRGAGPDGDGWLVDIEDPFDPARTVLTLRVRDRAVATSAPNRRRWRIAGREAHHLIDPRTGQPARSDLAQVTVLAATAERAEVFAKVAFVLGTREGERALRAAGDVEAVLVTTDGSVRCLGQLEVCDA